MYRHATTEECARYRPALSTPASVSTRRRVKYLNHHVLQPSPPIGEPSKMSDSADTDDAHDRLDSEDSEATLRGDSDLENESESDPHHDAGGGLFDLEAADSEDDEESAESEGESDVGSDDVSAEPLFPRFMYLPPELRRRVWEFFCPEILGMPRILEFVWYMVSKERPVSEGSSTANVTEASRTLAAVHRETREVALRAFPEALKLSGVQGEVRFSPYWDIVMLQHIQRFDPNEEWRFAPGFSDKVYNLAIHLNLLEEMPESPVDDLQAAFPKLRVLYPYFQRWDYENEVAWGESDQVQRYTVRTVDDAAGIVRYDEREFVWPDLLNHPVFANESVGPEWIRLGKIWPIRERDEGLRDSVEIWPMVEWSQDQDTSELEEEVDVEFDGEDQFDGSPGLDGYESDEIGMYADPMVHATDEVDSEEDLDQYEDDFVVDDGTVEYDEMGSDPPDGESEEDYGYGGHAHASFDHPGAYTGDPPAEFSDLEPESDEGAVQDSDDSEGGGSVRQVAVRNRPRRAVISDDEDDEDEEESEDGEEDVRQAPPRSRARPTIISEDEDEDEVGDDDDASQPPTRRRGRRMVLSEDEDDDE